MADRVREIAYDVAAKMEAKLRALGIVTTAHYECGIPLIEQAIRDAMGEVEHAHGPDCHIRDLEWSKDAFTAQGQRDEALEKLREVRADRDEERERVESLRALVREMHQALSYLRIPVDRALGDVGLRDVSIPKNITVHWTTSVEAAQQVRAVLARADEALREG